MDVAISTLDEVNSFVAEATVPALELVLSAVCRMTMALCCSSVDADTTVPATSEILSARRTVPVTTDQISIGPASSLLGPMRAD